MTMDVQRFQNSNFWWKLILIPSVLCVDCWLLLVDCCWLLTFSSLLVLSSSVFFCQRTGWKGGLWWAGETGDYLKIWKTNRPLAPLFYHGVATSNRSKILKWWINRHCYCSSLSNQGANFAMIDSKRASNCNVMAKKVRDRQITRQTDKELLSQKRKQNNTIQNATPS